MLIYHRGNEFKICPALGVMICNLISFCDKHKLELNIYNSDESSFEFITKSWAETFIFKYQYHTKRDYSDLARVHFPICTIRENSIKIVVNPNMDINKFNGS